MGERGYTAYVNKVGLKQKLPLIAAILLAILVPAASVGASNPAKPYLKTFGSDVMSGGWFSAGSDCSTDPTSNYQDPSYANAGAGIAANARNGGILTYAAKQGSGAYSGSSSQYAAFAAGMVEGIDASNYGFYSDSSQVATGSTAKNGLTFANSDSSTPWGGYFEGSVRQSNCIPDYYSKKLAAAASTTGLGAAIATGANAYTVTSGAGSVFDLTNDVPGGAVIPAGESITIYVNGNVYIGSNITYASHDATNIPKFAVVAKGSIYISANVTELDGVYVAQPASNGTLAPAADDGDIWTCHDNNTDPVLYSYPAFVASCSANKLTVNGALIAKQIVFMRLKGDVSSASQSEDSLNGANSSGNIGEVVNYTPEMDMGGAFFNQTTSTNLPVDSLISLPPIF